MRLLIPLVGVVLLFSGKCLAASSENFSEFDPKLGEADVHPISQVPPPPQIIDDPLDPSKEAQQDPSRKYKPKLKVGGSKPAKKTTSKTLKRTKTIAGNNFHHSGRKPASAKRTGHWMFCSPG